MSAPHRTAESALGRKCWRALWDPSSDSKDISVVFLPQTNMCLATCSCLSKSLSLSNNPGKSDLCFAEGLRKSQEPSRNLENGATCPKSRHAPRTSQKSAFRGRPHAAPRAARQRCRSQCQDPAAKRAVPCSAHVGSPGSAFVTSFCI